MTMNYDDSKPSKDAHLRSALSLALLAGAACSTSTHSVPIYEITEGSEAELRAQEAARRQPTEEELERESRRVSSGPVARPYLWEVEMDGVAPSYLFGTVHAGVTLDEALPGDHIGTIAAAEKVFVEVVPDQDLAERLAEAGRLRGESPLPQLLPSIVLNDLANILGTPELARRMKPWFVMMTLTQVRASQALEGWDGNSMDSTVIEFARQQGIEVAPLESADDQINALAATPDRQAAEEIQRVVEDPEGADARMRALFSTYRSGDVEAMEALVMSDDLVQESPEAYEALFVRRNRRWLRRLRPELAEGGRFVAVGLGHLLGEDGLVEQLEASGARLRRLR